MRHWPRQRLSGNLLLIGFTDPLQLPKASSMHLCHAYPSMNIFEKYNGWMISVATSAIGWVLTVDTHCGEVGTH